MANNSNLTSVGGNSSLTNTVKPLTKIQLDAVAINSGIISGPVNSTNSMDVAETRYMSNDTIRPKGGQDRTRSVSDSSYTNK